MNKTHLKVLMVSFFVVSIVSTGLMASLPLPTEHQVDGWLNKEKGFQPNVGQVADFENKAVSNVLFSVQEPGFTLYFKEEGVSYVIYQIEKKHEPFSSLTPDRLDRMQEAENILLHYARIDLDLLNSNIQKKNIIYEEELPGHTGYYLPQCPDGVFVKKYRKVRVKEVYSGIDWVFKYDEKGMLHHEFEVNPGADAGQIRFKVRWADTKLHDNGKQLTLSTPLGKISDGQIVAYEGTNIVNVTYKYFGDELGYDIKNRNTKEKLIIDPPLALLWATYYGGSAQDWCTSNTTDATGNIFVTGMTLSTNFPLLNPGGGAYFLGTHNGIPYYDAFILKFNNSGVLLWSTYYGGDDHDRAESIATDAAGNVFVIGQTEAFNFPTQDPGGGVFFQGFNAGWLELFILKFNNSGVRLWATYYGGSEAEVDHSITIDASGNIFITGNTVSLDLPTMNPGGGAYFQSSFSGGNRDMYILKFDNSLALEWATYYGGDGYDDSHSITTDAAANVFLTGRTSSINFPTQNPGGGAYFQSGVGLTNYSAFILKFDNTGTCLWATYMGDAENDIGHSILTDAAGNVWVCGFTGSPNFPTLNPGGGAYFKDTISGSSDIFIQKFNNSGVMLWSTYYGGNVSETGNSMAIDVAGNVYVIGTTSSTNFPTMNPGGGAYFQGVLQVQFDSFIMKFDNSGSSQWSTYIGCFASRYSIATDASGNIFTAMDGGSSSIVQDPGGGAYFQGMHAGGGGFETFIMKFDAALTGTGDLPEYSIMSIYPNPNTGHFTLETSQAGDKIISIIDVTGKCVYTNISSTLQSQIDIRHLTNGVYNVNVVSEKGSENIRFVKQ